MTHRTFHRINRRMGIAILISLIILSVVILDGCIENSKPWLTNNVKIEKISSYAPAKDHVIVSVDVINNNNFEGKIIVGADVNCGTVTWREKKKDLTIPPNSMSTAKIDFQGIKDRIPTMCKEYEYQARIYGSNERIIDESNKKVGEKPYGFPD